MTENTTPVNEVPSIKARLTRKVLIVVGTTVGIIIAGGIVLARKDAEESETEVDPFLVDEINSIATETN